MTSPLKIGHIGLCVPDLDAAVAWYQQVFDLELLDGPRTVAFGSREGALRDVFGPSFERAEVANLGSGNEVGIEMFQFIVPPNEDAQPSTYWRPGFSHLCFISDDIDETVFRIRQAGGRVRTSVWDEYPGLPYRFVHFEDPFGNLLELHSHPHRETVRAHPAS